MQLFSSESDLLGKLLRYGRTPHITGVDEGFARGVIQAYLEAPAEGGGLLLNGASEVSDEPESLFFLGLRLYSFFAFVTKSGVVSSRCSSCPAPVAAT